MHRRRRHRKSKSRDEFKQTENMNSQTTILILNDDCLHTITAHLQLQDLCSIAATCQRLNHICSQLYKRYKILDANSFLRTNQHTLTTETKIERIVQEIGHHVKSFHVSRHLQETNGVARTKALIKCVLQHCNIIRELKIDFTLDDEFLKEMLEMENFQKLETFDLSCSASEAGKHLLNLKNLKYYNLYIKF